MVQSPCLIAVSPRHSHTKHMSTRTQLRLSGKNSGKGPMAYESWLIYAFSICYGGLILVIDGLFRDVVVTPMMGLLWMMGNAFFRRPREIAIVGGILLCFVVASLIHESIVTIAVRSTSFIIGSVLAILFANHKWCSNERLTQIFKIIESVPANVVASDEQGTILAASFMAEDLIGDTYKPVSGHLFMDVFMLNMSPASALMIYREWFQRSGSFDCEVYLGGHDNKILKAKAESSGSGDSRILVLMFQSDR